MKDLKITQNDLSIARQRREKWQIILFINLFTSVFLIVFQPFGVNNYDSTHQLSLIFVAAMFGFGIVNGLVMAIYEFVIAPRLFVRSTTRNDFLKLLLLLPMVSFSTFWFYNLLGNWHDWKLSSFLGFLRDVSFLALLPIAGVVLYSMYKREKEKNKQLEISDSGRNFVWLVSENGKEKLGLELNHLLYLEAQDNYVAIYQLQSGHKKKTLLRSSLKRMQQQLVNSSVKRCHRSFLVNLDLVQAVKNKGSYMQLILPQIEEPIPVSRNFVHDIKQQLAVPPS